MSNTYIRLVDVPVTESISINSKLLSIDTVLNLTQFITVDDLTLYLANTTSYRNQINTSYALSNTAYSMANAAVIAANTAYGLSNTVYNQTNTTIQLANTTYNTLNTVQILANATYSSANSSSLAANGAYTVANSAYNLANLAIVVSNTASNLANVSFNNSNNASTTANNSLGLSNTAFGTANTVYTFTTGVYDIANAAFNQANTAYTLANTVTYLDTANAAFGRANAAYIQANSAYDAANTASISIINEIGSSNTFYLTFANNNTGLLSDVYVSNTKLYFVPNTGTLSATVFNTLSDRELKENIISIDNGLTVIEQIRPVEFIWKDSKIKSFGVVAQELEEIIPDLVTTNYNKSVNYDGIIAFLIKSVQELSDKIKKLENNE